MVAAKLEAVASASVSVKSRTGTLVTAVPSVAVGGVKTTFVGVNGRSVTVKLTEPVLTEKALGPPVVLASAVCGLLKVEAVPLVMSQARAGRSTATSAKSTSKSAPPSRGRKRVI